MKIFKSVFVTSLFALIALSGVAPATAADLGGNCCADLEDRIAELEATTARKGNRKVKLEIYGEVNKAIVFTDDDTKIIDNTTEESRVGFKGTSRINAKTEVGYMLEVNTSYTDYGTPDPTGDDLHVRRAAFWVDTEYGRVVLGQFESAAYQVTEATTANTAMAVRSLNLFGIAPFDGNIENVIRYDTPKWNGFWVSASWGSDSESKELALRYSDTIGEFKLLGGLAVIDNEYADFVSGSVSAMHVKTGVFGSLAASFDDGDAVWHITGGVEQKLNDFGATTFYAEYGDLNDFIGEDGYGLGVVQAFDNAALDGYASFRKFADEDVFMVGSRIKF